MKTNQTFLQDMGDPDVGVIQSDVKCHIVTRKAVFYVTGAEAGKGK